mmetsp:Transcript_16584/g.24738  ORF Transcript_16584/g.24738 Transcript_16584/m.24738 type:complete len:135 (+) Transcript_16584:83-487(+)
MIQKFLLLITIIFCITQYVYCDEPSHAYINSKGIVQNSGGGTPLNATNVGPGQYCIGPAGDKPVNYFGTYATVVVTPQTQPQGADGWFIANAITGHGNVCNSLGGILVNTARLTDSGPSRENTDFTIMLVPDSD